ncbi:MFS transporter [Lentzea sp. HUAS12]|uniref:MFS transporter n=1 Tax=Lentzea sp. HUAS12 TaxID=2951806 RepID=UPI00209E0FD2|nr:MFS transporter [Lentzea sp. HUAS12]USX56698.1 MFS transporter [Lentzea sp. HUAS12]
MNGNGTTRVAGTPQLLLLLAASSMSVLGSVLIAPVLPLMAQEFAATPGVAVLVPIVLTVPALMIGLVSPFAGVVVDRLGRVRLLIAAMVAYAIFGTAPLYLDGLGAIIGSRVLVGVCEAAIMTCCTTLIGDYWSGAKRNRYLGLQATVAAVSATLFLLLGGLLGASGWRTPFWMYFVSLALVIPLARSLWAPTPSAVQRTRLEPVPWRGLLAPCGVTFLGGIVFYALIVQLSYVLDAAGVTSTGVIGLISAVMSIATAIGGAVFGRLAGLGRRKLLVGEFLLAATGLVVVAASGSVPMITAGAVLTGLGTGALLPTLLTWALDLLDFVHRGRGTGLWTGTLFVGQFISPLVIAGMTAAAGGLRPALAILGAASAVLAATLWLRLASPDHATRVSDVVLPSETC